MERFQSKNSFTPIQFCVFDVIYYKGKKVAHLSLIERKELLKSFLPQNDEVVLVQWIEGNAEASFKLVQEQDLEGIVMKRKVSKYQIDKRSMDWLKVINYKYADVFITGLRKNEFGMLLSIKNDNQIEYAGLMDFMAPKEKAIFYREYKDLIIDENKNFFYLKPQIKCRVKYRNYTKKGLLRNPSFVEYIS
jgi:DNA ligase-1